MLRFWRTKAFYEFEWIVPFYETLELISYDIRNLVEFITKIVSLLKPDKSDHISQVKSNFALLDVSPYSPILDPIKDSKLPNTTKISADLALKRFYETFDAVNLFFGNRHEIPYIFDQMLFSIEQLEAFHILEEIQLEFDLFYIFNGFLGYI